MANNSPINRREFIRTALAASAGTTAWSQVRKSLPSNPNVLFILADDLGYGDLSCYGRPDYKTPVLDKLAAEGVKFTDAYAAAPVCTPTRCAFHTGRYPQRLAVGLEEPLVDANDSLGLPPAHPTIASLIKQSGYETVLIGKWHLGVRPEWGPNQHGYDEFFGFLRGYTDYFDHKNTQGLDLYENLEPADRAGYLTDLLTDRAIEYIGRRRTKPFYLSLHYSAPHWPWEGPEDAAISHAHSPYTDGGNPRVFGAMMKSLDT
ncbi:MAG TPA: sulfatase-like hydrolase/transferase, partial [Gemmatimonadaceae bacterium]|nr:sulfatase-like hydrolase/transferase [Gemmatimonadaceae bacterium]